jgi:Zn-dependent peptidase ImmA (M78 family)
MAFENVFEIIEKHQQKAPVLVDALARDLGIKVYPTTLPDGIYGKLSRDPARGGESGYAIYVNSRNAEVRQRFTVAHEIAHFALHRDLMDSEIVDKTMYRSDLSSAYETQANRLAAEVLMPSKLVRFEYSQAPVDKHLRASWLALKFKVSSAAMEIRLKSLGLN